MKKGINKSILFYIASVLFLVASAIDFTSGNENSMAIVWLCLGSSFLCLGGGSNAMGMFYNFIPDKQVRVIGCEAAGKGLGLKSVFIFLRIIMG